MRLLAATANGIHDITSASRELEGRRVTALAPASWTRLWAVVDGTGVWRYDGDGWRPFATAPEGLELKCLADVRANHEDGILAGTSRARLLRIAPDGAAEMVTSFDAVPVRDHWFTPWGGPPDTRSITEDGSAVYVNVHVGGILRSRDEGATWEPTIDVRADVHQVATGLGRVYAAGAHGLSVSTDQGTSWTLHAGGLHAAYCRAVAVCGERVLLSASRGPGGGEAALYAAGLDGEPLERVTGFFDGNLDTYCVDALPDGSAAAFATESGEVHTSTDGGATWNLAAEGLGEIRRLLILPT